MDIIPILYHIPFCYKANLLLTLNEFLKVKISVICVNSLNNEDTSKLLEKSPTSSFPLLQIGDCFLSGTRAIMKYFISLSDNKQYNLIGLDNALESSLIEMWIDYTINNIWIIRENVILPKDNSKTDIENRNNNINENNEFKKNILNDLINILGKINSNLLFKTFLVGYNLTLADIVMACSLKDLFESKFVESNLLSKMNNVLRWFKYVTNLNQYKAINGEFKTDLFN